MAWKVGERRACSACGVQCVGAKSRHGSVGPIEVELNPKGNVLLFKDRKDDLRYAVMPGHGATDPKKRAAADAVLVFVEENMMARRMNHFATCPEAAKFARGGRVTEEDGDDGPTDGA